jgi:hypothetical protein
MYFRLINRDWLRGWRFTRGEHDDGEFTLLRVDAHGSVNPIFRIKALTLTHA